MTVLVYLRSHFGYAFFRPKSLFFALAWAFAIFSLIAWNESGLWQTFHAACIFGWGSIALYCFHLFSTMRRDVDGSGNHDHYSGRSHALLLSRIGLQSERSERVLHIWGEPLVVIVVSIVFKLLGQSLLSSWLFIAAVSLALSECLNWWSGIRRIKVERDSNKDAERQAERLNDKGAELEAPVAIRNEPQFLPRNTATADEKSKARRFAAILELKEPFTLVQAEENYKALIEVHHPDRNEFSAESTARTAELNEAIVYFRGKLRI